jgi:hypothetical protein
MGRQSFILIRVGMSGEGIRDILVCGRVFQVLEGRLRVP